jgi:putative SOS response-associated peptidase YedK
VAGSTYEFARLHRFCKSSENIPPIGDMPVKRISEVMRSRLLPRWVKGMTIGYLTFNVRAASVSSSPPFAVDKRLARDAISWI